MEQVLTKKQNYRLWQSGAFGNKLRAWQTFDEWWYERPMFVRPVALRVLLSLSGLRPCAYNLTRFHAFVIMREWVQGGIPRDGIMVNEMGPDDAIVLQGEYLNDAICPGYFLHSWVCKPMRAALAEKSETTVGLRSDLILRGAMTPASYDDWRILLEQYPGHVLEVSIYDRCLGDIPGRNALIWEVRKY